MRYLESEFPSELLSKTMPDKLSYFKSLIRTHDFFNEAEEAIIDSVLSPIRNRIVLVIGPTGVGKSALSRRILQRIINMYRSQMVTDPGMIPISKVNLPQPGGGFFDWKEIHSLSLKSLQDILIDRKSDPARLYSSIRSPQSRSTLSALKEAHIHALINRKVVAFIFDEANHLTLTANSKQLLLNLECIKSLVDSSDVPHILFGTYDLLKLRNLNGQLIRRCKDIHFPRYHSTVKREREAFERFLLTLLRQVPLKKVVDPIANGTTDYFFERTIGLLGMLRDWILLALDQTLKNGKDELDMGVIEKTAVSIEACQELANEANRGESSFLVDVNDQERLRRAVGYNVIETDKEDRDEGGDIEQQLQQKLSNKKGSRRPGTRKTMRDVVGL